MGGYVSGKMADYSSGILTNYLASGAWVSKFYVSCPKQLSFMKP